MTPSVGYEIQSYRAELAEAAQKVYDEWDQEDEYCAYGSGGICDDVSDALRDVLVGHGFNTYEGAPEGDDHSWTIAEKDDQYFGVDIAPWVYESGQGYCWVKTPNVRIKPDDVQIWSMSFEDVQDIIEERRDRNFRILEGSYKEQDIPAFFYKAINLRRQMQKGDILRGKLTHSGGVSSSPFIYNRILGSVLVDSLITMPASGFLSLNKVSRVLYSNSKYIISNNLKVYRRVRSISSIVSCLQYLFSTLGRGIDANNFDIRVQRNTSTPILRLREDPDRVFVCNDRRYPIETEKDIFKIFRVCALAIKREIDADGSGLDSIRKAEILRSVEICLSVSFETFQTHLLHTILGEVGDFKLEEEWILKNEYLIIPPGSDLRIIEYNRFDDDDIAFRKKVMENPELRQVFDKIAWGRGG